MYIELYTFQQPVYNASTVHALHHVIEVSHSVCMQESNKVREVASQCFAELLLYMKTIDVKMCELL